MNIIGLRKFFITDIAHIRMVNVWNAIQVVTQMEVIKVVRQIIQE